MKLVGNPVVGFVMCAAVALPAFAATPQEQVNRLVAQFASRNNEAAIASAVNADIDFDTIVSRSFEPGEWQSFSPAQKRQLVDAFREYIAARYYMRWHKIFGRSQLSFGDQSRTEDATFLRTYVKHGQDEDTVIWTLNHANQIVDLNVNGKDLLQRLSQTARPQLQKRGADKFIVWMQEQAATAHKRANEATASSSSQAI